MRYSFYQYFGDDDENTFRLYFQSNSAFVRCIEFKNNIKQISNEPGITRLFGKEIFDISGNYHLFPLDFQNVEVGDFTILQDDEKVFSFKFMSENSILQDNWILRRLSTGDLLFWKPFPIVSVMPTSSMQVKTTQEIEQLPIVQQEFSIFNVKVEDGIFEGIGIAQGVWTGRDLHTTLFTKDIINSIYNQMKDTIDKQMVDINHSFVNDGKITEVSLGIERGIQFVYVKGRVNSDVPLGSGLSIILESTIDWDTDLNIFVLVSTKPLGVSIITEGTPACSICMIK